MIPSRIKLTIQLKGSHVLDGPDQFLLGYTQVDTVRLLEDKPPVDELIQRLTLEIKGLDELCIQGIAELFSVLLHQLIVSTAVRLHTNRCTVDHRNTVSSLLTIAAHAPEYENHNNDPEDHLDQPRPSVFSH